MRKILLSTIVVTSLLLLGSAAFAMETLRSNCNNSYGLNTWFDGFGGKSSLESMKQSPSVIPGGAQAGTVQLETYGITLGVDYTVAKSSFGACYLYSTSNANYNAGNYPNTFPVPPMVGTPIGADTGNGSSNQIFGYGAREIGTRGSVSGLCGFNWSDFNDVYNSSFGAGAFFLQLGADYKLIKTQRFTLRPELNIGLFEMSYDTKDVLPVAYPPLPKFGDTGYLTGGTFYEVDFLANADFRMTNCLTLTSTFGYRHVTNADGPVWGLVDSPANYPTPGVSPAGTSFYTIPMGSAIRDIFMMDLGCEWMLTPSLKLGAEFNMQIGNYNYEMYGGTAMLTWTPGARGQLASAEDSRGWSRRSRSIGQTVLRHFSGIATGNWIAQGQKSLIP